MPAGVLPDLQRVIDAWPALTGDELRWLLAVAEQRGRKLWYLAAVLAGLRKSELGKLRWTDIDLKQGSITVRNGKAKRIDVIPLHTQLADEFQRRRDQMKAMPQAKVFPQIVTDVTRLKDFFHAGLAREQVVVGEDGQPIMIGTGRRRRPKTRLVTEDAEGRVVDLHAMRTTLGTMLARQGTKPQVAREIMRHSDYQTTLAHYTMLGLSDTAGAINELPDIGEPETTSATGTMDATSDPPHIPQRVVREAVQFGATASEQDTIINDQPKESNQLESAGLSDDMQLDATPDDKAGEGTRTLNIQLGRLTLYQLSYARIFVVQCSTWLHRVASNGTYGRASCVVAVGPTRSLSHRIAPFRARVVGATFGSSIVGAGRSGRVT